MKTSRWHRAVSVAELLSLRRRADSVMDSGSFTPMHHTRCIQRGIITCQATPDAYRRQKRNGGGLSRQKEAASRRGSGGGAAASTAAAIIPSESLDLMPQRALQALSRYRALVLDSSYRPIDVVNWQRAICMDLLSKADVLEYYDASVSSVSAEFFLPAVMRSRTYLSGKKVGRLGRVTLNRRNILLRDNFSCQYCGRQGSSILTLDHVIPQSKGGKNSWENLVTACAPCNTKKGDKTLKDLRWKLRKHPKEPSPWELNLVLAAIGANTKSQVPQEWANYLFFKQGSTSDLEDLEDRP